LCGQDVGSVDQRRGDVGHGPRLPTAPLPGTAVAAVAVGARSCRWGSQPGAGGWSPVVRIRTVSTMTASTISASTTPDAAPASAGPEPTGSSRTSPSPASSHTGSWRGGAGLIVDEKYWRAARPTEWASTALPAAPMVAPSP